MVYAPVAHPSPTLLKLIQRNKGAQEAFALGMDEASIIHYATWWPHGIGKEPRARPAS